MNLDADGDFFFVGGEEISLWTRGEAHGSTWIRCREEGRGGHNETGAETVLRGECLGKGNLGNFCILKNLNILAMELNGFVTSATDNVWLLNWAAKLFELGMLREWIYSWFTWEKRPGVSLQGEGSWTRALEDITQHHYCQLNFEVKMHLHKWFPRLNTQNCIQFPTFSCYFFCAVSHAWWICLTGSILINNLAFGSNV